MKSKERAGFKLSNQSVEIDSHKFNRKMNNKKKWAEHRC